MSASAAKARTLVEAKEQASADEKVADESKRRYRSLEADFWLDLEDSSTPSVTLDLGEPYGRVQFIRRETITGRVINEEVAEKSLSELGIDDAILGPRKPRQKVLSEHVRTWLESGQELPEGVDFSARRYVTVTRKNK